MTLLQKYYKTFGQIVQKDLVDAPGEELVELKAVLQREKSRITSQLDNATMGRDQTNRSTRWFKSAREAKRMKGSLMQLIQAEETRRKGQRRKASFDGVGDFQHCLLVAIREVLTPDQRELVIKRAKELQADESWQEEARRRTK